MNPQFTEEMLSAAPHVFEIDEFGDAIEVPQNTEGEYEYDINIQAIESLIRICENYQMRSSHMDFNWKRVMAQSHIKLIIEHLQENL